MLWTISQVRLRMFVFCVLVIIENASSRLVAARGGKKGRFHLFDRDVILSPEKDLRAAVGMDRHLRDQQAPCLFIPNLY